MRLRSALIGATVVGCSVMITGCSSSSNEQNATTTSQPGQTSTTAISDPSTTSTTSSLATNIPVTNEIRSQLVTAAAALDNIPVAEFTGLAPGLTYYALDNETNSYWAAGRLVPASSSDASNPTQAQVSSQDAGSYYLFHQSQGGVWTVYADGNTGPNTPCPVTLPPAVLQVWGWAAGSCRPSGV